ncbi:MAG: LysR family transcriptional regulator, partial [Frisingicoccus sp.]
MNRYEVFIKVVECGSFTKAAEVLDYTQSAVSQMVHTLEEELSTVLLLRSKNGITLTADGEAYYPYICSINNAHRELEEKYREMQGLGGGKIRIGSFT